MKFKKVLLLLLLAVVVFSFTACKLGKKNAPVINGAVDKTIEKGSQFLPLEGITATDKEDGDLTDQIQPDLGRFNKNVVGSYPITYRVTDSDGNVAEVTITITVEDNDKVAPLLTGVQDKSIVVGDTAFSLTEGVVASDVVDGDVTASLQTVGNVDPWKLGDYSVEYSAKDKSGNEVKKVRTITVGLGEFQFGDLEAKTLVQEGNDYQFATALSEIDKTISAFALAKLEFKVNAAAACDLVPSITNGSAPAKISLAAGENTVVVYFRITVPFDEGFVKLTAPAGASLTFSDVKYALAEAKDMTPPTITFDATKEVVLPGTLTDEAALSKFVLEGVSANDNIDGIITSKLAVDFTGINLGNCFEEKQVKIYVVDSNNNKAEVLRTVKFVNVYDTKIISDPEFNTAYEPYNEKTHIGWGLNGGAGDPELNIVDGVMVHHNRATANPGWDSASSPFYRTTTEVLEPYNWYMVKFDVKAERARKMTVRIGLETTEALGWIENFVGGNNTPFSLTTEWQTCYVLFYIHAAQSEGGMNVVKIELKVGTFTWGAEEQGNTVYFDNVQVYLLTNENSAPTFTLKKNLPTTFGKGQDKPDLTQYVTAYDREDASNIAITAANITESVNMNQAGIYDVVYKVADSNGKEATYTLKIKVLETADTTIPVLAEAAGITKEFDQNGTAPDLTKLITATDNIDGAIAIDEDMITTTFDIKKAGSYEVKYTVKDSSGNAAELTLTLVVKDKEAPVISGKATKTINEGEALTIDDILATLTVKDNVDQNIVLAAANVRDFDKVNVDEPGEYPVIIEATDAAGNKGTFVLKVIVSAGIPVEYSPDELVVDLGPVSSSKAESCTVTEANGEYTIAIESLGQWASDNKIKYTGLELESGKTYVLKFVAKAEEERKVKFNIGIGLDGTSTGVWMDYFTLDEEGSDTITLSTEYKEYLVVFTYDKENRESGPMMEFCLGPVGHTGDKAGNDVFFKELAIYTAKEELALDVLDPDDYILGNGYYNSTDSSRHNTFINNDTTAKKFVGTIFFTKSTLPVGSVIEIAEGYQYRPEGWVDDGQQASREGNVSTFRVVVTEEWWGNYIKRAFNISKLQTPEIDAEAAYNAAVAAFKIYVPRNVKEDVDLIAKSELIKNAHEVYEAFYFNKVGGGEWDWVGLTVNNDLTGYTKVVAKIMGTAGETVLFKANDQKPGEYTATFNGTLQDVEFTLPADWAWDATKKSMIMFANPGATGNGHYVIVAKLELQGEGKDPIDLLAGKVENSVCYNVGKGLVIIKPETNTNQWDSAQLNNSLNFTGYKGIKYRIQGTAGEKFIIKPNDQSAYEVNIALTGEIQEGIIDVSDMVIDPAKKVIIMFANPGVTGTGKPVILYELSFLVDLPKPAQPEPTEPEPADGVEAKNIIPNAVNQSANYVTWSTDYSTATLSNLQKTITGGQWGRWDFASNEDAGYVKVVVVLHVTPGLKVMAKLDALANTPGNNAYDGIRGNKQTLTAGEDGELRFVWSLADFAAAAQAAGKAYELSYLQKFVFFACDGTEGEDIMSSATIELVSIKLE